MNLAIVTPEGVTTEADVDRVSVPGSAGQFVVLRGHAPLVSTLAAGVVQYGRGGVQRERRVGGGVVRVERGEVSIIIEG